MARYSLFMLKVPLNPKQTNKQTNHQSNYIGPTTFSGCLTMIAPVGSTPNFAGPAPRTRPQLTPMIVSVRRECCHLFEQLNVE